MREILTIIILVTSLITLLYPIIMSVVWLSGGLVYNYKKSKQEPLDFNQEEQYFDIVIPVFNEGEAIKTYILNNINLNYQNYRLIIIDDCSSDNTYKYIKEVVKDYENKIVLHHMPKNIGKAKVLNYAIDKLVTSEYFLCVDSDAVIDSDALKYLNAHIKTSKVKHSAITGYPNLLNTREDLIHTSQQVEYRSIIGMIKKAQANFGSIMTVSGVCTAYNTNDIKEVGYFDTSNATEDIEITWRLQRNNYDVYFLPEMIVKMYSPDYVHELLTQRARWTLGGLQTFVKNRGVLVSKNRIMLKLFLLEALLSCIWTICFIISTGFIIIMALVKYPFDVSVTHIMLIFGLMLFVSFIYLLSAYVIEKGKKESPFQFVKVLLFYPFIYWFIYPIGYLMGFIRYLKLLIFKNKSAGTWRGNEANNEFNISLKLRYIFSLIYDLVIFLISFGLIRAILLTFISPLLSSEVQYVVFALIFNLLYFMLILYMFVYFPLKTGASPGKRLLGIMQVKTSGMKLNIVQLVLNPIVLVFTFYLIVRFGFLILGLSAFLTNDTSTFYFQFLNTIEFSSSNFYQTLSLGILFLVDVLLANLLFVITKTKIIKAEKIEGEISSVGTKIKRSKKISYIFLYVFLFIIVSSLFLYGLNIKYKTLYPTSVTCSSSEIINLVSEEFNLNTPIMLNDVQKEEVTSGINKALNTNINSSDFDLYKIYTDDMANAFTIIDFNDNTLAYNDFMEEVGSKIYLLDVAYSIELNTNRIYTGRMDLGIFNKEMQYVDNLVCS